MPSMIYRKSTLASGSSHFLRFLTKLSRSPPAHNSITNMMCLLVSNVSYNFTTDWCRNLSKMPTSCMILDLCLSSDRYS